MRNINKVNFSKLAPIYDLLGSLAFVGRLHRSQTHLIPLYPKQPKNILIMGGGTGKFLIELLKAITFENITYIDLSPKMITLARNKVSVSYPESLSKMHFICGDETTIPKKSYDLIITHYFLDCFTETDFVKVAESLYDHLQATGTWSMVDFSNPQNNHIKGSIIGFLYGFFRLTCQLNVKNIPDFDPWFEQKLGRRYDKEFIGGLLKSTIYTKN